MPTLRTDDDIYRVRLTWLGPTGLTLPVHLPYAQWGLGALLATGSAGAAWLLTGSLALVWLAVCVSAPTTALIFRYVNPDRPARKILRTAAKDWRQATPDPAAQLPSYGVAHIRFRRGTR